jgi:hypothetical protein
MFICYTSVTLISNKCSSALALKIWNWVCSRRVPAEEEVSAASLYDDISPRSAHRENLQTRLHWNAFKWSWRCCSSSLAANFLRSSLLTQRHALHAHKAHSQDEIKQLRFPSLQTPQQCTKHSVATPWCTGITSRSLRQRGCELAAIQGTAMMFASCGTGCHRWRMHVSVHVFTLEVSKNKVKDIKCIFS